MVWYHIFMYYEDTNKINKETNKIADGFKSTKLLFFWFCKQGSHH